MVNRSAMWVGLDASGNGMTPSDGRRALGALYGTTARPLLQPSASSSSSNMQITVAQNVWQLPDPTDAASIFVSPTDSFIVTPAAGAGSTRIDSIVIKQDDPQNSATDPYSVPSLIAGTPGSGAPTIPAGTYEVARVTVPAGASNAAACTVQFRYPNGIATPHLVGPAATTPTVTGSFVGQRTYGSDGIEYRWNGTAWKPWESDWISYVPAGTNLTLGTINAAQYRYAGGKVHARLSVVATAFGTGNLQISAPVASDGAAGALPVGNTIWVASGNRYTFDLDFSSTTTFTFRYLSNTQGAISDVTNTAPITWPANTTIILTAIYDPA